MRERKRKHYSKRKREEERRKRERKYRGERKGLGKENGVRGGTRRRRGMSMAGVPPMGGFRGKRKIERRFKRKDGH